MVSALPAAMLRELWESGPMVSEAAAFCPHGILTLLRRLKSLWKMQVPVVTHSQGQGFVCGSMLQANKSGNCWSCDCACSSSVTFVLPSFWHCCNILWYFSKPCPQKQSLSVPMQPCEPLSYILPRLQWDWGTSLRQFLRQGKQENVTANSQGSSITQAFLLSLSDCIWEHLDSLKCAAWRQVRGGNFT